MHVKIIKRYSNRKLYDTELSQYINETELLDYIRSGQTVQVLMNITEEDVTKQILWRAIAMKQDANEFSLDSLFRMVTEGIK